MTRTSYSEYKPSEIEWLGDIPRCWRVAEVKHTHRVTLGKMLQSEPKESSDVLLPYLRAAHIPPTGFMLDDPKEMWFSRGEVAELTLKKGDVVVVEGGMGGYGRCDIVPEDVPGWGFQNSINRLRPIDDNCGAYTKYLLQTAREKGFIDVLCSVSTMPHLTAEKLAAIRLPLPSPDEQWAIADFLDRETAKIDALIAKQEQLIAALREDRTATITHAVTKGLDPGVEMKDTGNALFGTIPREWSVRPFLRCVKGRVDYRGATPKKVDDGVLLITARNVRPGWIDYTVSEEYVSAEDYGEIMRRGLPEVDDLLFTMEAPLGNAALVDRTDIALAQRVIKFRPDQRLVRPKFLLYTVIAESFQTQLVARATGSTALGLKASKLPELQVTVPAIKEQRQIVKFLDERCGQVDALIAKAIEMIETLREYRSALITDAVTGKIDVRGAA